MRQSLSPDLIEYIDTILSLKNTICILLTNDASSICAVVTEPSTSQIYNYNTKYVDFIVKHDLFFDFMVCGKDEIENIEHEFVITKEDWDAFRRKA